MLFNRKIARFFKIILRSERRFRIPKKFVRDYGHSLSSPIKLEVPNGVIWQVELSKNEDEVWLEKGWIEFAKYYSLKHRHFLVFEYKGNCHFSVTIFSKVVILGKGAVEIDYPGKPNENQQTQVPNIQEPGGISLQKSINPATYKSPVIPIEDSDCSSQEPKGGNLCQTKVSQPLQETVSFASKYPYFQVVLKKNKNRKKYIHVPRAFVRKFMEHETQTVVLKVADRSWYVKLNVYETSSTLTCIYSFIKENSLKIGDICIFELIKKQTLRVSIFKHDPDT